MERRNSRTATSTWASGSRVDTTATALLPEVRPLSTFIFPTIFYFILFIHSFLFDLNSIGLKEDNLSNPTWAPLLHPALFPLFLLQTRLSWIISHNIIKLCYNLANGTVFKGIWAKNMLNGHGKQLWPNGDEYSGALSPHLSSTFTLFPSFFLLFIRFFVSIVVCKVIGFQIGDMVKERSASRPQASRSSARTLPPPFFLSSLYSK
jgi:hypothetical protein